MQSQGPLVSKITQCINCGSSNLERFIDLGDQPNGNHFPSDSTVHNEPRFPFAMCVCKDCWQVQIEQFPSEEFMFLNHPYITGLNQPVVSHFKNLARQIVLKYSLEPNSLVLDIGANDGTLLSEFKELGMRVMGIDPCKNTNSLISEKGIPICKSFFDENSAAALESLNLGIKLITATAVIYHLSDFHGFMRGLAKLVKKDVLFVGQCVYMKDVLEKLQFDHFYHEHIMMHSLTPLKRIFDEYGLRIIDIDFYDIHGGSFAFAVVSKESSFEESPSVSQAINAERAAGLEEIDTYHRFAKGVESNRDELVDLMRQLRQEGKSIYALGAPLKGSTLCNYCGLGTDLIDYAVEVNPFKIGKLTPGTHIPVIAESDVVNQPDYYLVLSWNFLNFFKQKYSDFLRNGGKFIVPHPVVSILGDEKASK